MKKKVLIICLLTSLVLNLIFGSLLFYKTNNKSNYGKGFIREISFAIDRFKGYEETSSEGEYIVAVAHLYSAYTMLANVDEKELTYKQLDDFQKLWNYSAAYPQIVKANLLEIIDILSLIKADYNFDDTNALLRLQEIITKIMHTAK